MTERYTLYDTALSGNGWKVRFLLADLGIEVDRRIVTPKLGENRTEAFRQINLFQKLPVLEFPDGHRRSESNAILYYLAEAAGRLPQEAGLRADMLGWMFREQHDIAPNVSYLRYHCHIACDIRPDAHELVAYRDRLRRVLQDTATHLADRSFLVGESSTIADMALYPFIRVSDEAGIELEAFPALSRWLRRIETMPWYMPLLAAEGPGRLQQQDRT